MKAATRVKNISPHVIIKLLVPLEGKGLRGGGGGARAGHVNLLRSMVASCQVPELEQSHVYLSAGCWQLWHCDGKSVYPPLET